MVMFAPTWPRLCIFTDRFVHNFVNLGNLYSKPFRQSCSAFLEDGTNVLWDVDLGHTALEHELRVLRDFKEDIKQNVPDTIDSLWVMYVVIFTHLLIDCSCLTGSPW